MENVIRSHIEELTKELESIDKNINKLAEKFVSGKTTDKDVANLVEQSNKKRERQFAIFNLYQILGKAPNSMGGG